MSGLNVSFDALSRLQSDYLQQASTLWNDTVERLSTKAAEDVPKLADRRFAATEWASNPATAYMAQMYLLNARTLMQLADSIQGDEKTKARIRFAVQQWVDAASPSNYLALNPEAQRRALETGGESIAQGLQHLLHDIQQGHLSQTDETVFEVGRNVATSEGAVVFENELFQLLEYKPLTAKVHERPMLFVPPCINKFYILDLQPDNSLIRYTVSQGHRTFVISWRNPDESLAAKTWDDYIEDAVLQAIRVVQEITAAEQINTLGFCVGGTLLACALAVLAARGEQPAASLTLLTTFLDFSNTGVLDLFVDEASVQLRETTIGPDAPTGPGMLNGKELAATFSFLRPNDLVWNYVVGNYLKGETPPPFDLLYWNSDSTNLPGPWYCWYLRNMYLENNLKVPGKLTVCGAKVDLGRIKAPAYVYASREDHIVPWDAAYLNTQVLKGKTRFVLGASGHIAGVINPPEKKKRSHWTTKASAALPPTAAQWFANAQEAPGSWWPDWADWLKAHAGKQIAAPKTFGNKRYKAIEPAPGRYVKAKA
ncbi:class I poly(R)-hydroxyalkanoic acid synthase [Ideonella sp. BN130291]|uniref:class I poly(R)-hydroxyalkanoic acid synthase n=1 Tax=Ideonella sp. BN130291 TaxID=3112940 RepID=UPI002E25DF2F|nr:class I poly(R)-hydroxyalkanoic acid synthase [Ideonella sp. BN130291]